MQKKTSKKAKGAAFIPMAVVNPHAAGIDVGDTLHAVAVPVDRVVALQLCAGQSDQDDRPGWDGAGFGGTE